MELCAGGYIFIGIVTGFYMVCSVGTHSLGSGGGCLIWLVTAPIAFIGGLVLWPLMWLWWLISGLI